MQLDLHICLPKNLMSYVNAPYTGIKIFRCSLRDNWTIFAFHKIAEKNGSFCFFFVKGLPIFGL